MVSSIVSIGLAIGLPIILTALAIIVLRYSSAQKVTYAYEQPASTGTGSALSKFVAENGTALATAMVIAIVFVVMVIRPLQYLPVHDESTPVRSWLLKGSLSVDSHGRHVDSGDTFEAILDVTAAQHGRACHPKNLTVTLAAPNADVTLAQSLDVYWPDCHGRAKWLVAPKKSGRLLLGASLASSDTRSKKSYEVGTAVVGADIASDLPLSDGLLGAFVSLLSALIVAVFSKKPQG